MTSFNNFIKNSPGILNIRLIFSKFFVIVITLGYSKYCKWLSLFLKHWYWRLWLTVGEDRNCLYRAFFFLIDFKRPFVNKGFIITVFFVVTFFIGKQLLYTDEKASKKLLYALQGLSSDIFSQLCYWSSVLNLAMLIANFSQ